ncbi:damage-control phosphatase At2g17340-like [Hibiscus syriacus]|uniref:damage-control phosphatase At2g17340-like n=1 Tax=Hibiscus syriacus TaxID=106335 RepID=UPI00192469C5|nr:damage-control phosphatase At2g17340-like [Hibiscus syriacus]
MRSKRAESDTTVPDAPSLQLKLRNMLKGMLIYLMTSRKIPIPKAMEDGGPPDCILLGRIREQIIRELGFGDIFKKVKVSIEIYAIGSCFARNCCFICDLLEFQNITF